MEKIIIDFDPELCTACAACMMACFDQHEIDLANGQRPFRTSCELEDVNGTEATFAYMSVACMHCEDAPCVVACPAGCLRKDPETGLTLYDNTNCIGCHSCAMACPFGAPTFNAEGKMEKCDGCYERLKAGMQPACVRVCPRKALTCVTESEYNKKQAGRSLRTLAKQILDSAKETL